MDLEEANTYQNGVEQTVTVNSSSSSNNGTSIATSASSAVEVELEDLATVKPTEFVPYLRDTNRTKYEEAALFVQEGIDNDKFDSHPNGVYSKIAFNIVHNPLFYTTELVVCCLLLALAIIEEPSLLTITGNNHAIIVVIHSVLEMLLLSLIACSILLRFIWMKPKTFLYQRTTFAALIMLVMFIEAMVVLIRRENHFRVTRCLRPIFFIDSYLMVGVRRVLRQLIQCLKPIIDVMLLLLLMVATFAYAGYYLFADIDPTYFDTYLKSYISLFITLTTANHPDVFMEAYVRNRAAPLFFVLYLLVTLFFFSNVLLGVLYGHFSEVDKMKFRKLYLHKRKAMRLAYSVLVDNPIKGINFHDFLLFMLIYKPRIPEYQVMCIFKALQFDPDPQESLCLEEFYRFYEVQNLKWKQIKKDGRTYTWYDNFHDKPKQFFKVIHKLERFRFFDHIFTIVVLLNATFLITYTVITSYYCGMDDTGDTGEISLKNSLLQYCESDRFIAANGALVGSFIFTGIYMFEIVIRLLADGPIQYYKKKWNWYDSFVIVTSFILLCIEATYSQSYHKLSYLVVFRPVKLLRIVKLKKSYYRILTAISYLGERLISVLLLLMVVFYFYAIIGMEIFQGAVYVGCCETALFGIGQYYTSNVTQYGVNAYWLNNFDNIYQSYITLYEQLVVNNWYIQMEGYVSETTVFSRLFFFAFWMTTTVCLSVAIAYIVDAFVFNIQQSDNKQSCTCERHSWFKCDCNNNNTHGKKIVTVIMKSEEITLLDAEINNLKRTLHSSINNAIKRLQFFDRLVYNDDEVKFIGKSFRSKEVLNLEKYRNELEEWIEQNERERQTEERVPLKQTIKNTIWNGIKKLLQFILE